MFWGQFASSFELFVNALGVTVTFVYWSCDWDQKGPTESADAAQCSNNDWVLA